MPKKSDKLGYPCPVCGLDHGIDKLVSQKSTRKRGQERHALSARKTEVDRIHLSKLASKPVEYALGNIILELHEKYWLDNAADQLLRSLKDGTWNTLTDIVQDSILKRIADIKASADLRTRLQKDEEMKYGEWDIALTEHDTPFLELAIKLSKPYRDEDDITDRAREKTVFNPAKEILRYRRKGDPLRHLDVSEDRQTRVLAKYHSFRQKIIDEGKFDILQRGSQVFIQYRKPFSDALWIYTWVEWFWIVLYAYKVSAREAARMLKALNGQSIGKISSQQIKNRMQSVIGFWQDFYEYVPPYLEYLNEVESLTRKDPELYRIDRTESAEDARVENEVIEGLIRSHCNASQTSSIKAGDPRQINEPTGQKFNIHRVTKVGKEMILVRHSNRHYKDELDEFNRRLRRTKPQRKTSCFFDPWKQRPEVLAALIRKGTLDVGKLGFEFDPQTDADASFR